ncbi:hypothetical protein CBW56_15855 [Denitratisoma oestradiolicum]|nr:hypothetical protein CBW56_15855 [Denitratisoma oestradiolicum]
MDQAILAAWNQAKSGFNDEPFECAADELYRVLAPRCFQIVVHFMAHPGMSIREAALWLGIAEPRLADEVGRLLASGMLEEGLFGLTAAADLRDPDCAGKQP